MERRDGPPTQEQLHALYERARIVCTEAKALCETGDARYPRFDARVAAIRAAEFERARSRQPTALRHTLARQKARRHSDGG